MLTVIVKVIIGWLVLMYSSINLLGLFVRGLFPNRGIEQIASESKNFLQNEAKKAKRADLMVTLFAAGLIILYFYLLLHFFHFGVAIAALLFMIARLPDLLWEIKHGEKMNKSNMPKGFIYIMDVFLMIGAVPVLWWAFLN